MKARSVNEEIGFKRGENPYNNLNIGLFSQAIKFVQD